MKTTQSTLLALSTALGLASLSFSAAAAGTLSGTVNAQMTLQAGCIVTGAPSAGPSGVNFGTLDFGVQPSTFTGVLTSTASGGAGGAGTTQITCSPDVTSLNISVGAGNNAGQGASIGTGSRALKFGSSSYLPYEVYSDSGMSNAYPSSSSVGITLPGTGAAFPLPIYGRINKTSTAAMASGTYTDVLQVTLSW